MGEAEPKRISGPVRLYENVLGEHDCTSVFPYIKLLQGCKGILVFGDWLLTVC